MSKKISTETLPVGGWKPQLEKYLQGVLWGRSYMWKISGASMESVWKIVGDYVAVDKWVSSVVKSSHLLYGDANTRGSVRQFICYPSEEGASYTYDNSELLLMDEATHQYIYTIIGGDITGFSLMKDYVSSVKLVSLDDNTVIMHWGFNCRPMPAFNEEECIEIVINLYQTAMKDLAKALSISEDSITFLD